MNITVGLTNCAHLNGYLAAILHFSYNFSVIPIRLVFSTIRRTQTLFPFKADHFEHCNFIMGTASETTLQKNSWNVEI